MPRLAKAALITPRHVIIDGDEFPYWLSEDGPRIDPPGLHALTVLWLPVVVSRKVSTHDPR